MAFRFNAERLDVDVVRLEGRYRVALTPVGHSDVPRDFTFWLNPWYPPIDTVDVEIEGVPLPGLRILPYGGQPDDGEQLLLVTNYPPRVLDTVSVNYSVSGSEPTACGIWIFLDDMDGSTIENLSPKGAMDIKWDGTATGTLVLPRPMLSDSLVLFSEPWCSDHVPQYGDRHGIIAGPFGLRDQTIQIDLDSVW